MKSYKGWTAEERKASDKLTKEAIARGDIPPPTKCNRCGQDKGIIHYHNEDYSHPTKYLEALCWRCHLMHHSARRAPDAVKRYFAEVANGKQYPPVYRNNLRVLQDDHGVPGNKPASSPKRNESVQASLFGPKPEPAPVVKPTAKPDIYNQRQTWYWHPGGPVMASIPTERRS